MLCYVWLLTLVIALRTEAFPLVADRMYRLHQIKMCEYGSTPPLVLLTNLSTSGGKNQFSVSGVMNVTRDLSPPWKLTNNTTRCSVPGNECEVREPFVTDRICDAIFVPVFAVLNAFQPPITGCSIERNIYRVPNATFDMTMFSVKYPENWRFKSKMRIIGASDELVFCTDFEWSMMNLPRKKSRLQRS